MSPDHDQSALFLSAALNLVLFLIISALLIFVFKRSLRQRWRRRAQRNSESLPLLNIPAVANSSEDEADLNQQRSPYVRQPLHAAQAPQQQPPQQQPPQQQPPQQQPPQQQPPQQQPPQQQPPQQQEQQRNDDLISIDLESQTSEREQTDVPKTKWFQRMFKKR
jgi:outer membrane biosynthesis protein TonB